MFGGPHAQRPLGGTEGALRCGAEVTAGRSEPALLDAVAQGAEADGVHHHQHPVVTERDAGHVQAEALFQSKAECLRRGL